MKYTSNSLIIWRSLVQAQAGPQIEQRVLHIAVRLFFIYNQAVISINCYGFKGSFMVKRPHSLLYSDCTYNAVLSKISAYLSIC